MDIEPQEEIDSEEERVGGPSIQTMVTAGFVVCAVVAAIFAYYLVGSGTSPERECVYRGGTWSPESDCVFESADGTAQVGMHISTLTLSVPQVAGAKATFSDIEIGSSAGSYSTSFVQGDGLPDGSIALLHEFGRVEKVTGDLIVPFAVTYGGTGIFTYLGVFQKTTQGYVQTDSVLVGDRIGVEGLTIGAAPTSGSYTAKLLYRDRHPGEAMAEVPRDPRTLEVIVEAHAFGQSYILSREGVLYADMLSVRAPLPGDQVASPLTVRGSARGPWFFEGSFPMRLVGEDGTVLAEGNAQAKGDWMTDAAVEFSGTLTFNLSESASKGRATLILFKDNPSGLPEHDDRFEIPVVLK